MKFLVAAAALLGLSLSFAPQARAELKTVPQLDVGRYMGVWYQIARKPVVFELGCVCSRQKLDLNPEGTINVFNSCNKASTRGPVSDIRGTAKPTDATNAKLEVDFGLPWTGQYWVIGLDADYRYAVVSDPDNTSLYVLSKTPTLPKDLYDQAVKDASTQVDTSVLEMTQQEGCIYP